MKICPVCKQTFPTKQALAAHMATAHVGPNRRPRPSRIQTTGTSTMVLYRRELCTTAIKNDTAVVLEVFPGKSGLSTLDALSQMYEEFKIIQWSVSIVPNVGTNANGSYTCGFSYSSTKRPASAAGIASLSPSISKPVYAPSTLSVNPRKIMGAPWLPTFGSDGARTPGAFVLLTDAAPMVWITYKVLFNGPTSVKRAAFDDVYKFDARKKRWVDEDDQPVDRLDYLEPVNMQLEIGTNDPNIATAIENAFQRAYSNLQRMHSVFNQLIAFSHFIANLMVGALPVLAAPAILHVQRRPFRAILLQLVELGYNPSPREDPPARRGEYHSEDCESNLSLQSLRLDDGEPWA